MRNRISLALLLLSTLTVGPIHAQVAGQDRFSVGAFGGGFSPSRSLGGDSEFDTSGAVGSTATLWVQRYVGLRAHALYAQTELLNAAVGSPAVEEPNVWVYGGELLLRLPFAGRGPADSWFPYLVGGAGAKTYDFEGLDSETDFAGSFGGGVEYRRGSWGLQTEVRDVVSQFDHLGFDETQHDVVYTAGITFSH